jgi:phosphoglycolate phosphatase-like HAD superfamily hydrolase
MKAILFDFDGVLHNTFDLHLKKIRDFSGYPLTGQEYRDMYNGNFHGHAVEALRDVDWLAYRDFVRKHFVNLVMEDEVKNTLRALRDQWDLFIVSSGGEDVIRGYLEKNGVSELFRAILGREFHTSKIEKFQYIFQQYGFGSGDAVYVTDTLGDILEAKRVELESIAVDFGFHPREKLEEGDPYRIISDFKDLIVIAETYESREQTKDRRGSDSYARR